MTNKSKLFMATLNNPKFKSDYDIYKIGHLTFPDDDTCLLAPSISDDARDDEIINSDYIKDCMERGNLVIGYARSEFPATSDLIDAAFIMRDHARTYGFSFSVVAMYESFDPMGCSKLIFFYNSKHIDLEELRLILCYQNTVAPDQEDYYDYHRVWQTMNHAQKYNGGIRIFDESNVEERYKTLCNELAQRKVKRDVMNKLKRI